MPTFSASDDATCDLERDLAIVSVCCVLFVVTVFVKESFDLVRIKSLHASGASRKSKFLPEKSGDFHWLNFNRRLDFSSRLLNIDVCLSSPSKPSFNTKSCGNFL